MFIVRMPDRLQYRRAIRVRRTACVTRWWLAILAALLMLEPAWPSAALAAQPAPVPIQASADTDRFDAQQLDALLAPVALYPDTLLTQLLIAATFPLQIVEASRWLDDPAHKDLKGEALTEALKPLAWDPSVKSIVPFPQVLSQLNTNLEWTQQLGYAFANQQKDVLDSVQRLRRQAQGQGQLKSTPQQVVRTEAPRGGGPETVEQTIVIEPAQPDVVYVPSYNPAVVYGPWPYPAYPPVAAPPSPGYVAGTALLGGLAFGTGVAVSSALWGWSSPNWNHGDVNVNVNRWNSINVNRQRAVSNTWSPAWNRAAGQAVNLRRPPAGPVGRPVRNAGLPANAIGRRNVNVPANLVNRPVRANAPSFNPANRPNLNPGSRPRPASERPRFAGSGQRGRPGANFQRAPGGAGSRFNPQQFGQGQRFQPRASQSQRPGPAAFGGIGEGGRAGAFGQRGAQSRQIGAFRPQQFQGGFRGGGGFHGNGGFRGGFRGRR